MYSAEEEERTGHPLMRITTLGEFAIARLVGASTSAQERPPRYVRVARSEWSNRGPAMTLLKVLLCRGERRATRDELIEAIWPDHEAINAAHALDSAASVLRRHILRADDAGSLLLTLRSGGETIFKLAGQQRLWVDADALLSLVSKAMRAECGGQDPLPLLEQAYALARGEFLEDDLYAAWAQPRRHTINGARHRALFKLVDLYLNDGHVGLAEELLFSALEEEPTDEDALCRLMLLLAKQERRQEALQLYQYSRDVLREEKDEPADYTRELARRIRQGLTLRERGGFYSVAQARIPAAVGLHSASIEQGNICEVEWTGLVSVVTPFMSQMALSFRYRPPRRRSCDRRVS
jgi:DNA-binding SARP family transcriptional activator